MLGTSGLAVLLILAQDPAGGPLLENEASVAGEIAEGDAVVTSANLARNYTSGVNRGRTYRLRVDTPGTWVIDLRSSHFDAYLILRDEDGRPIVEDDDGLVAMHARITAELRADRTYFVDACACKGDTGSFSLRVQRGPRPSLEDRRVADLAEARRAVATCQATLGVEHASTATMLNILGFFSDRNGNLAAAERAHRQCLEIRTSLFSPDDLRIAAIQNDLASTLRKLGSYTEGERLLREARRIREKRLGADHPATSTVLNNLAVVLKLQARYGEAEPLFRQSLAVRRAQFGPDNRRTARAMNNLAKLLSDRGSYEEAEGLFRHALAIAERSSAGPVAAYASNLASTLSSQGRYGEAELQHERALKLRRAAFPDGSHWVAQSLAALGVLASRRGRHAQAEQLFGEALAMCREHLGHGHRACGQVIGHLGRLMQQLGRHNEAEVRLTEALEIAEQALGDHPQTARALGDLAGLLVELGRHGEARPLLGRAVALHEQFLGHNHPSTVDCLTKTAELEADLGRVDVARECVRQAALQTLAYVRGLFRTGAGEIERLRYVRQNRRSVDLMLSLALLPKGAGEARSAYELLLEWNGQVFRDTSRVRRHLNRVIAVTGELKDLQTELGKVFAGGRNKPAGWRELVQRRDALEGELMRLHRPGTDSERIGVEEIARALPKGSAVVDLQIHRRYVPARFEGDTMIERGAWHPASVSAWVVLPGAASVHHVGLGAATALQKAVTDYLHSFVRERGRAPRVEPRKGSNPGERLRRMVWQKIRPHVGDAEVVFVIPDGFLATLPFESLPRQGGGFLIEDHSFVYLEDAMGVARLDTSPRSGKPSFLGMGGVDFSGARQTSQRMRPIDRRWSRLSATRDEIDAIEDSFRLVVGDDAARKVLRDLEATEEALRRELPTAQVAHLATHGFFSPNRATALSETERAELADGVPGLLCGLVCAGANLEPESGSCDQMLTANEVGWLDLARCELVVLSACQTGLGQSADGEGLISLRRAFRQAGARTVISSLWKVRDGATRELMIDFYHRHLEKGQTPLAALRGAQLAMLARNREEYGEPLPATWAAFVLCGDWR